MAPEEDKIDLSVDALSAMAAGEPARSAPEPPADPNDPQIDELDAGARAVASMDVAGGVPEPDVGAFVDVPADQPPDDDAPVIDADTVFSAAGATDRKTRAAGYTHRAKLAHAHQLKKTMTPLLLVVGGLLLVFGVVVAVMLPGSDGSGGAERTMMNQPMTKYLVLLAFPLGAILLFGAWWFHRDVSRAEKARRQVQQQR